MLYHPRRNDIKTRQKPFMWRKPWRRYTFVYLKTYNSMKLVNHSSLGIAPSACKQIGEGLHQVLNSLHVRYISLHDSSIHGLGGCDHSIGSEPTKPSVEGFQENLEILNSKRHEWHESMPSKNVWFSSRLQPEEHCQPSCKRCFDVTFNSTKIDWCIDI